MVSSARTVRRTWRSVAASLTLVAAVAAVGVVSSGVVGGCGGNAKKGPSVAELTSWAQSLDVVVTDVERLSASYLKVVKMVDKVYDKNATALKQWNKEWKKRQAAYQKDVAAVESYNAEEQAKERAPSFTPPVYKVVEVPGYNGTTMHMLVRVSPDESDPGYTPQLKALPAKPEMPAKVKVDLGIQIKKLKQIESKLGSLQEQLSGLVTGSEFAAVLTDAQGTVADLQSRVHTTLLALKKAVKKDKRRGDVIVRKQVALVKGGNIKTSVSALRDALLKAAEAAGVADALAQASPVANASPSVSASPGP